MKNRVIKRERWTERERAPICWLSLPMATIARIRPDPSQESEAPAPRGSPVWIVGPNALTPSSQTH